MRKYSKIVWAGILFAAFLGTLPLAAQYYEGQEEEWLPKIRIELGGGWLSTVFGDMYLTSDYDDDTHAFLYDKRFTWMYENRAIEYWSVSGLDDGFPSMKNAIPLEVKVRFQSPWNLVTFGVGFRMLSRKSESQLPIEYIRAVTTNEGYVEGAKYDLYKMQVHGYALPLTMYLNMTEGRGVDAGLYISAGPFYADALYEKSWTESFGSIIDGVTTPTAPSVSHSLRMEGKGWGVVLEAGTRLDFNVSRQFGIFLEAGFLYQGTFSLSGAGKEVNGPTVETWEGKWKLRTSTHTAEWDTAGTEITAVDNRPTAAAGVTKEETYSLNTKGGTIRAGISIRF